MANRDVIAVGTSAGGVEALIFLAKNISRNIPASILVTIHLPSHARSALHELLSRVGPLPASFATEGEGIKKSAHLYRAAGPALAARRRSPAIGLGTA